MCRNKCQGMDRISQGCPPVTERRPNRHRWGSHRKPVGHVTFNVVRPVPEQCPNSVPPMSPRHIVGSPTTTYRSPTGRSVTATLVQTGYKRRTILDYHHCVLCAHHHGISYSTSAAPAGKDAERPRGATAQTSCGVGSSSGGRGGAETARKAGETVVGAAMVAATCAVWPI